MTFNPDKTDGYVLYCRQFNNYTTGRKPDACLQDQLGVDQEFSTSLWFDGGRGKL